MHGPISAFVDNLISTQVEQLENLQLCHKNGNQITGTELGSSMAKFCIRLSTMQCIMEHLWKEECTFPELINVVANSAEVGHLRLRKDEKKHLKELQQTAANQMPHRIRYPSTATAF